MKQLEIPFEFIDNTNEICLYKVDDWVLINKKKNDPIKLKTLEGNHMYVANIVRGKVFNNSWPESRILSRDIENSKKLTIEDYIGLNNTLKHKNLTLNKKKGEIYGFP